MTFTTTEPVSVKIQNLTKLYLSSGKQITAVDNVSLDIEAGEFVTLLGPSGCGKTTILRMVAGFEVPSGGDIFIGDTRVNSITPDKRDTAMVFQSYALFPHLNVFDNISYGLKLRKRPAEEIRTDVMDILHLVGLEGLENRQPNQLSGGQQQRVALARALIMKPSVLLFDEPLSNLDAKLRISMRREIRRIQKEFGITSLYVTHDQAEAMSMSDRVIILKGGILQQVGSPWDIYLHPNNRFVADFIGLANLIPVEMLNYCGERATVRLAGAELTVPVSRTCEATSGAVSLVIRPETVALSPTGQISGIVESSVFMGAYQDYHIRLEDTLLQVIDYNPAGKQIFQAGETVGLTLNPEVLQLVDR